MNQAAKNPGKPSGKSLLSRRQDRETGDLPKISSYLRKSIDSGDQDKVPFCIQKVAFVIFISKCFRVPAMLRAVRWPRPVPSVAVRLWLQLAGRQQIQVVR